MRYWICIDTPCAYLTIGKIYTTDDCGYFLRDDWGVIYTTKNITEIRLSQFEEVKGEDEVEDLREMIKPCMFVRMRGESCPVIAIKEKDSEIGFYSLNNGIVRGLSSLSSYDEKLANYKFSKYDIVEVMDYTGGNGLLESGESIWKREEKSPAQIKIEELEAKQREIADEMEKLRKEL